MIKYLLIMLTLISAEQCVTPDQDRQLLVINHEAVNFKQLNIIKTYNISNDDFNGKIHLLKSDSDFVDIIMSNYIVDTDKSALIHLSQNYILALFEIENKKDQISKFNTDDLTLQWNGKKIIPLHPNEYPQEIHCLNWKGNIKNFYNLIAISVVTAYTVNAMFACIEGKCKGIEDMDKWLKENHPAYNKGKRFLSNAIFKTTIDFNQKINASQIEFESKAIAKGVILYRNPGKYTEFQNFLTIGNCIVD
ncbi:hypothetical protein JWG45_15900 [Leptospira sp. 201903070]|uniref:Uncharacterized protein n=1 Tax=Leptospira ainlahdjerensis TaxID=2810033 RepID=A0ABS2UFQ8_9LEPT|nr:hypothetical protein [Leptospira ainlahdjerensis]MBM9578629.1 hypothetical protein [Leptospira ainlahdjerensis]